MSQKERLWHVGEANFMKEVRAGMNLPKRVYIFDETLREGEETPGVNMTIQDKVEIARVLEEIGVPELNVGYMGYIAEHAEAAKAIKKACPNIKLTGYIRAHGSAKVSDSLEIARDAGVDKVDVNIPGSDYQFAVKELTKGKVIDISAEAIGLAKEKGFEVTFGPYDTTRIDMDFLKTLLKVGEKAGATRIRAYDTLGVLNPPATRWWISELTKAVSIPIQYHCHDDFGMSVANTCAAVEGGAEVVDLVVNGLGDRAGNTSFEETVLALECLYNVDTGIDLSALCKLSKLVQKISGVNVPPNKAVVGKNTFIHEADIHVQAILSGRWYTFEPYHPTVVGQERTVYFGSTTSSDSVEMKARQMGVSLSQQKMEAVLDEIQKIVKKKTYASEQEVADLIKKA